MSKQVQAATIVYFDGECPVCSREVAMYQRQPGANGVCWVDVTRCTPQDLGTDLTREAAMARLHLRRPDGSLVSGAQAFTTLWCALPRWSWLGRLLGAWPPLWALEAGYRMFLGIRRLWRPKTLSPRSTPTEPTSPRQ